MARLGNTVVVILIIGLFSVCQERPSERPPENIRARLISPRLPLSRITTAAKQGICGSWRPHPGPRGPGERGGGSGFPSSYPLSAALILRARVTLACKITPDRAPRRGSEALRNEPARRRPWHPRDRHPSRHHALPRRAGKSRRPSCCFPSSRLLPRRARWP